jgi:hypothetical protein
VPRSRPAGIGNLPTNLSALDREQLREARASRDERMSFLFRGWPSLSTIEMRELRKLSDERQRLAKHVGILRRLHLLRARPARRDLARVATSTSAQSPE